MSRDWTQEELKRASEQMKKQDALSYEEFVKEMENQMSKTMIFTTTDVIKRARKLGKSDAYKELINSLSQEEFRHLNEEMNHLCKEFFNISKIEDNPEKFFLNSCFSAALLCEIEKQPETTRLACVLLGCGAKSLIKDKVESLNKALEEYER